MGTKWNKELELHKQAIVSLGIMVAEKKKISDKFMGLVMASGETLAMHYADYKCQKCESEDITIHHLINGKNKDFMPLERYVASKFYWNNIIVLCPICHLELEGNDSSDFAGKMGVISEEKKQAAKARYT